MACRSCYSRAMFRFVHHAVGLLLVGLLPTVLFADGPADNDETKVRRVPKLGVEVPAKERAELEAGLKSLAEKIAQLRRPMGDKKSQTFRARYLPDVEVLHKAVADALTHQEFLADGEVKAGLSLIQLGLDRAVQLQAGEAPWATANGLVIRGFVSRLDGSVQPYGLEIPASIKPGATGPVRLDVWLHGRNENVGEVAFLEQRRKSPGRIAPAHTIVLHPFGRYSNAFKFAGEVDVFEAIESVSQHYAIDRDRIVMRGFSMGGAGCWQFATRYPDVWVAATPGAGFSETPLFLKSFQGETLKAFPWEVKLWEMYDSPSHVINLSQVPTIAYSGDMDRQKQAADVMEEAAKKEGMALRHLIGPKTGHAIENGALAETERLLADIVAKGRDRFPREVRFVTHTLKYNRAHWVQIDALDTHWEPARVEAEYRREKGISATVKNVREITFDVPAGHSPFDPQQPVIVNLNEQKIRTSAPLTDRSFRVTLHRDGETWKVGPLPAVEGFVRKRHNLQGPIDDAFMDSFLFVKPTGKSAHPQADEWAKAELARAIEHWRRHFRGDARVKNDTDVTDDDMRRHHLVLWGDPGSNAVLAKLGRQLPIVWEPDTIRVGKQTFAASSHGLAMIAPNPLAPSRYVVLNSSFTYREYDYLNNARQTPKLPDWAIFDLRTPPGTRYAGKVVAADFFDEQWRVKTGP